MKIENTERYIEKDAITIQDVENMECCQMLKYCNSTVTVKFFEGTYGLSYFPKYGYDILDDSRQVYKILHDKIEEFYVKLANGDKILVNPRLN